MAYIDRDKVLKAVEKMDRLDKETKTKFEYDKEGFLLLIKSAPTEDVQEVKHGKWISTRPSGGYDFYCSCCKEFAITYEDSNYREQYLLTNYCPNCGAKMDLKGGVAAVG